MINATVLGERPANQTVWPKSFKVTAVVTT